MPLYLVIYNPSGQFARPKIIDLDTEPAPTIMATGIGGTVRSCYHLFEGKNEAELLQRLEPFFASVRRRQEANPKRKSP